MQYRTVIFDFDGTVADSFGHFLVIVNRLAKDFSFRAVMPDEVDAFRDKNSGEVIRDLHIPLLKLPRILAEARSAFNEVIPEVQLIPGMPEVLHQLRKTAEIGLITSNSAENVTLFLKNNDLNIFNFSFFSKGLWGKILYLKKVIRQQRLDRKEILYVGDETRDIEISRKVGVKAASVTWGYNSSQVLKKFSPDYLINIPKELLSICENG